MMRVVALTMVVVCMLWVSSCGSGNSSSTNVTGNWSGTLSTTNGQSAFTFTISLNQAGDNSVTGTNLKFSSGAPCFQQVTSEKGQFTLNSTFNGVTSNMLQLTVIGGEPGESTFNTLTMQGAVTNNTVTGTWVMEGPAAGCTGNGSFTLTKS